MSLLERLKAKATDHIVDSNTREARMAICRDCPSLIAVTNICRECGCLMTGKTWLRNVACPLDKWSVADDK